MSKKKDDDTATVESITYESLSEQLDELVENLKNFDDFKLGIAFRIIFETVNYSTSNIFEALGLLEEVKLEYKKISDECSEDCSEYDDDDEEDDDESFDKKLN